MSTRPKCSPGPWEWYGDGSLHDKYGETITGPGPYPLRSPSPAGQDGNAALIAAAPLMYEVLSRYHALWHSFDSDRPRCPEGCTAAAALRAARGEGSQLYTFAPPTEGYPGLRLLVG